MPISGSVWTRCERCTQSPSPTAAAPSGHTVIGPQVAVRLQQLGLIRRRDRSPTLELAYDVRDALLRWSATRTTVVRAPRSDSSLWRERPSAEDVLEPDAHRGTKGGSAKGQ